MNRLLGDLDERRRLVMPVLGNLICLVIFGSVAFRLNQANLFYGLDGTEIETLVRQEWSWLPMQLGFANNFFQSLGNVMFPVNMNLIPGYAIPLFLNGGTVAVPFSYVIFSIELFLSAYLLALWLGFGNTAATLGGWILALAAMPYFGLANMCGILAIAPNVTTVMLVTVLAVMLFGTVGRRRLDLSMICLAAMAVLLFYLVVSQPAFFVLVGPIVAIFATALLLAAEARGELVTKLAGVGLVAAVLLVAGVPQFLIGLYKYTAAYVFWDEFVNNRQNWYDVSIVFNGPAWGPWGPAFYSGALIGGVGALIGTRGTPRTVALTMLAAMAALMALGALAVWVDFWQGPMAIYFEFLLWPFYAVYAALLLTRLGRAVGARAMSWRHEPAVALGESWRRRQQYIAGVAIAVLPWGMLALSHAGPPVPISYPYPPAMTPIVGTLRDEIGLVPGGRFRGRVATFTGLSLAGRIWWPELHYFDHEKVIKQFGNDHRTVGFWHYDIPTLFEYNQFITPPFYLVSRTFLARSEDRQIRNIMTLRRIEPRFLRAMGVSFLVTDVSLDGHPWAHRRLRLDGEPPLFLYELEDPNLGTFTPTDVTVATDASQALAAMSRPDFDPARTVVTDVPLTAELVPAQPHGLFVERDGLRVRAASAGTSILLLPLEYSHCLELDRTNPAPHVRLFRANLVQTGVVFSGRLDTTVRFFTGPLYHRGCRGDDATDMRRLKVVEARRPRARS